jgi:3D-(3,5/4)-trihydroxycyclohexane-1,2-dione acylhydrolase (decyclizing)
MYHTSERPQRAGGLQISGHRLTVAQALIRFLALQRVEFDGHVEPLFGGILGILGHGNLAGIGEALESDDALRFIPARNEQAMVHVAVGYAWRHRRRKVLACTTSVGPGATNLVTGAALATINRLPVLLLPGDVFATRRVQPVLQQLEIPASPGVTVNDSLRAVSRYWDRIERPEQLLTALPAAMRILTSPTSTGAVTLALPEDVQVEAMDVPDHFLEPRTWRIDRAEPSAASVADLAGAISDASRPLIVAGGGIRYSAAEEALSAATEAYGVPVVETQAGKGSLAWDHAWNLGPIGVTGAPAANAYAAQADLVLSIGCRMSDFTTGSTRLLAGANDRWSINVDELDAVKAGATPIVADARRTLDALVDPTLRASRPRAVAAIEVRRALVAAAVEVGPDAGTDDRLTQRRVIAVVNEALGGVGTMVCAAGSLPGDLHRHWRAQSPDDYHVEYGYSCMGYEIAGGLGVQLADPTRPVVVLVGDGSYLMLASEIITAIQEHAPIAIVVVDSGGHRSISALSASLGGSDQFTRRRVRDPHSGRLDGPTIAVDFAANARSLGAYAREVTTPRLLAEELADAWRRTVPSVLVVSVDAADDRPSDGAWWDVPVAEVSAREGVRTARQAYEAVTSENPARG